MSKPSPISKTETYLVVIIFILLLIYIYIYIYSYHINNMVSKHYFEIIQDEKT